MYPLQLRLLDLVLLTKSLSFKFPPICRLYFGGFGVLPHGTWLNVLGEKKKKKNLDLHLMNIQHKFRLLLDTGLERVALKLVGGRA